MVPVQYLGWLFPIGLTLFVIWTWWLDFRLYKENFWHALKVTYSAALNSRVKVFLWVTVFLIAGSGLCLISFGRDLLFPICSFISVAVATITWVAHPPGVVLLASSESKQARQLAVSISRTALGHRVLYFLDPQSHHALRAAKPSSFDGGMNDLMNNRFLRTDDKWSETVFPLLELVPVIVIDASQMSPGLQFELQRINSSPALLSKTLIIVDGSQEVGIGRYSHLANRVIRSSELQKSVVLTLSAWKRRSLNSSIRSQSRLSAPLRCSKCGTPMRVITGNVIYRKDGRTQGCFQCRACERFTCYDCSDNRVPCECRQKQWVERSYFLD